MNTMIQAKVLVIGAVVITVALVAVYIIGQRPDQYTSKNTYKNRVCTIVKAEPRYPVPGQIDYAGHSCAY
jgi:hypothetical protein